MNASTIFFKIREKKTKFRRKRTEHRQKPEKNHHLLNLPRNLQISSPFHGIQLAVLLYGTDESVAGTSAEPKCDIDHCQGMG